MAIRVLATIPDLSPTPPKGVARPEAPAPVKGVRDKAPMVAARTLGDRAARRGRKRSMFPTSSIVALAVIAAAIWSYVAVREIRGPDNGKAVPRIAADVGSATQGTTLR